MINVPADAGPGYWADIRRLTLLVGVTHQGPLLKAAQRGRLDLALLGSRADRPELPGWSTKPAIVLVGDDSAQRTGPAAWVHIERIRRWGRAAIIYGAEGEAAHYRDALDTASAVRRLVLVETSSAYVDEWASALAPLPTTIIVPPLGLTHPVATVH